MSRLLKRLLGALAACLLLAACQASPSSSSSDQLPSIPPVLTITPGQSAASASTPGAGGGAPSAITPDPSGAVLGAPEHAFVIRLGQPGPGSVAGQTDRFGRAAGATCDAFVVSFVQGHANSILRHSCATPTPGIDQRLNEATTFIPVDTMVGKAIQTAQGDEGTINTSATLAKALPTDAFRDCNHQTLTPGTFAVILTSDGWLVAAGSCESGS